MHPEADRGGRTGPPRQLPDLGHRGQTVPHPTEPIRHHQPAQLVAQADIPLAGQRCSRSTLDASCVRTASEISRARARTSPNSIRPTAASRPSIGPSTDQAASVLLVDRPWSVPKPVSQRHEAPAHRDGQHIPTGSNPGTAQPDPTTMESTRPSRRLLTRLATGAIAVHVCFELGAGVRMPFAPLLGPAPAVLRA